MQWKIQAYKKERKEASSVSGVSLHPRWTWFLSLSPLIIILNYYISNKYWEHHCTSGNHVLNTWTNDSACCTKGWYKVRNEHGNCNLKHTNTCEHTHVLGPEWRARVHQELTCGKAHGERACGRSRTERRISTAHAGCEPGMSLLGQVSKWDAMQGDTRK